MTTLLQLQNGAKSFGARSLFEGASFAVNAGEHVGVIGPNGAGKTTLFKILTGEEGLDHGDIVRSRDLRIGYLAQHESWGDKTTVADYLGACPTPLWELKQFGRRLGLDSESFDRPVKSFSGGYRMRVKLLSLIGHKPNLMMLDEPTNYLDLETLLVLEEFLQGFDGAFLLISHDREFLRRTTDHILEVEDGDMTKYPGNIDDYFEQKDLLRAQLEARALSVEQKRRSVLDFVARFGAKATKARQAQSRLKSLDRLETIEIKPLHVGAAIRIPPPVRTGKLIVRADGARLGYGHHTVLHDLHFDITSGDHLGVVGFNGAGKTTLLKALAGKLAPLHGKIDLGYNVTVGYYAQHVSESLDPALTVLEAMQEMAHPDVLPQEVKTLAGSLLFSGDDAKKKISVLSGGERSRVALGRILLQKAPCLLLDEPTNHLDFQTVEALTQALHGYEGSVVVVSHDRGFLRRVATKILEIRGGRAVPYHGTYDDYVWSLQKGALSERVSREPTAPGSTTDTGGEASKLQTPNERRKELERELRGLGKEIDSLDKKLAGQHAVVEGLNHKITAASGAELQKLIAELSAAQSLLDETEARWLAAGEKKERLESQLKTLR